MNGLISRTLNERADARRYPLSVGQALQGLEGLLFYCLRATKIFLGVRNGVINYPSFINHKVQFQEAV
jgi:hypothetical protein